MTISVRLDSRTEALLNRLARTRGRSRSDVVRDSIHALVRAGETVSPRQGGALLERFRPFLGVISTRGSLLTPEARSRMTSRIRERNFDPRPD